MSMRPAPLDLLPEPGALIGDRVIHEGSGGEYEHVYAANGRPTKRVPLSGSHEVELATKAARDALPVWQGMSSNDRRRLLLRAAELVRDGADLLGTLTTVDSATPKAGNDVAASWGAEFLEYNAAWIDRIGGEIRPADQGRPMHAYTRDEPYGVVAAMTPFNAPIIAASMVLGPVLAAGNTIVLKPSHLAPYGILRLGQLFLEAGFPPGVVNIVPGSGSVTGDALVRSPAVDKVFFEGSADTAEHVLVRRRRERSQTRRTRTRRQVSGDRLRRCRSCRRGPEHNWQRVHNGRPGLRLGYPALSAGIDIRRVRRPGGRARVVDCGGRSVRGDHRNGTRIQRKGLRTDPGRDLRSSRQCPGQDCRRRGACGGELAHGYFIAPTLFADVNPSAQIAREEIFGPVLCIMRIDDEAEALEISNDSPYGLGAYVYTNDVGRVHRMAEGLQSGMVYVNGSPAGGPAPGLPFGGVKHSGFGRLGGIEAIREFTRPKSVMIFL